jgi:hypothetical protein
MHTTIKSRSRLASAAFLILSTPLALADGITVVAGGDTRVVASFDETTSEVEAVEIETRDASGGWVLDSYETADAQDVVDGGAESLTGSTGDCDGNGVADWQDIAAGAEDRDRDGQLDACERSRGDVNLNGTVNQFDLFYVLGLWDSPLVSFGDADGDGEVSGGDIALVLLNFGT